MRHHGGGDPYPDESGPGHSGRKAGPEPGRYLRQTESQVRRLPLHLALPRHLQPVQPHQGLRQCKARLLLVRKRNSDISHRDDTQVPYDTHPAGRDLQGRQGRIRHSHREAVQHHPTALPERILHHQKGHSRHRILYSGHTEPGGTHRPVPLADTVLRDS